MASTCRRRLGYRHNLVLQEALSGRAHTTMLATVSPSSKSYVETMNTLKYAERLKRANAHLNKDPAGPRLTKVRIQFDSRRAVSLTSSRI